MAMQILWSAVHPRRPLHRLPLALLIRSMFSPYTMMNQQRPVAPLIINAMALGKHAYNVPISSVKSMIGHPLAGANGIELALSSLMFERNILPPTINQEEKDPQCDLNYIPNKAIEKKVNCILKTSSGFSG